MITRWTHPTGGPSNPHLHHRVDYLGGEVCSQNIPAGSTFTDDTTVDFGVVKLDEICP